MSNLIEKWNADANGAQLLSMCESSDERALMEKIMAATNTAAHAAKVLALDVFKTVDGDAGYTIALQVGSKNVELDVRVSELAPAL